MRPATPLKMPIASVVFRSRQQVFGRSSDPYPKYYSPRPYSRSFVRHLDVWYAQSHPDEDFAETLAVWLTPDSTWADRYKGWPVLKKLQYVNGLMQGLADIPPKVVTSEEIDPLSELKKTLREHYERKRKHYGTERPSLYDPDLKRLFSDASAHADKTERRHLLEPLPKRGAPQSRRLDRRISIYDRSGPRGHDSALPTAPLATCRSRKSRRSWISRFC